MSILSFHIVNSKSKESHICSDLEHKKQTYLVWTLGKISGARPIHPVHLSPANFPRYLPPQRRSPAAVHPAKGIFPQVCAAADPSRPPALRATPGEMRVGPRGSQSGRPIAREAAASRDKTCQAKQGRDRPRRDAASGCFSAGSFRRFSWILRRCHRSGKTALVSSAVLVPLGLCGEKLESQAKHRSAESAAKPPALPGRRHRPAGTSPRPLLRPRSALPGPLGAARGRPQPPRICRPALAAPPGGQPSALLRPARVAPRRERARGSAPSILAGKVRRAGTAQSCSAEPPAALCGVPLNRPPPFAGR